MRSVPADPPIWTMRMTSPQQPFRLPGSVARRLLHRRQCRLFFAGNGLLEKEGGQDHGPKRHIGRDDGGVGGGSKPNPEDKTALVENNGQQRGPEQLGKILRGDVLRWREPRNDSEKYGCSEDPQIVQHQRCNGSRYHHDLGQGRHEPPHEVGREHGRMAFPCMVFHFILPLYICSKTKRGKTFLSPRKLFFFLSFFAFSFLPLFRQPLGMLSCRLMAGRDSL